MAEAMDLSTLELGPVEILIRLIVAMLVGAIIGMEREFTNRPAGMRTQMLVSLGACVVMITSQLIFLEYRPYGATPDPARLSAQVITGVGFLGAGTILKEGPTIKGLTTAASLWAVACLGVAIGGGYLILGIAGAVCMLVTLVAFEYVQRFLMRNHSTHYLIKAYCTNVVEAMEVINRLAGENHADLSDIEISERKAGDYRITFKAIFMGRDTNSYMTHFISSLSDASVTNHVSGKPC